MSQGRPSHSPAGPSRLPVYLTGVPKLSSSPTSSTRSPRVSSASASNRIGFKRSSAFESFDAPTYCNDMASYIANQLANKPKRVNKRDQEIEAVNVGDKWRGSSSIDKMTDVSIQTAVDEEETAAEELREDIDQSRTEQIKAQADAFLQQLQTQPDELTETERGLEEQVLSFFGAEVYEQSSEKGELSDTNDTPPEVAAHIAGLLAEKEKTRSGPLIEEVVEHQGHNSESEEDSKNDESATSDEEDSESENDENQDLSYEERREALMRIESLPEEADELQDEDEESDDDDDIEESDAGIANGIDLYEDNLQARPPLTISETIELLDSDEDELQYHEEEEEEVHHMDMIDGEAEEEEAELAVLEDADFFSETNNVSAEARSDQPATLNFFSSAPELDVGEAWDNETGVDEMMGQEDIANSGNPLALMQAIEAATTANLFERPDAALMGFSDRVSSFAPLQDDDPPPSNLRPDENNSSENPQQDEVGSPVASTLTTHKVLQENLPPPVQPHLQQAAESGSDLLSLKHHLTTSNKDAPQTISVAAQPGTPQRAESIEQPRETNDGHARNSRDLLQIKSEARRTLEGNESLATSIISDIDSASHHIDVGSADLHQSVSDIKPVLDQRTEANEHAVLNADAIIQEARDAGNDVSLPDQHNLQENAVGSPVEKDGLEDELVDYVELADVVYDRGQDIDIQSFNGSYSSDHVYGHEEEELDFDPAGMLITITEEEQEADIPHSITQQDVEEGEEGLVRDSQHVIDQPVADEELDYYAGETREEEGAADAEALENVKEQMPDEISENGKGNVDKQDRSEATENVQNLDIEGEGIEVIEVQDDVQDAANKAEESQETKSARPRRSGRSKTQTSDITSPILPRRSLRKSQSRAPSEAAPEEDELVPLESPIKAKRGRRSRTVTVETPKKPKRSLRKSTSRAASEAASESSSKKRRQHHHKSDSGGDLADFVPEEAEPAEEEENESERPTKRHKVEDTKIEEEKEPVDADEEMLDTSILEEDATQMLVDDVVAEQEEIPNQEVDPLPARKRRGNARKSTTDTSFRLKKAEESESEEDKEVKLKKEEQIKKRREADREHRREQREAKRLEKEALQKEEKEAEKAAAGLVRKARISEDVKTYRPKTIDAEEGEEEEEESILPEKTIAKRRSKRSA